MDEKEVLKKTADVVLNKFLDIEFDIVKPTKEEFENNQTVKVFKVRRSCLDTLIFFSSLILDFKTDTATKEHGSFSDHLKAICDDGALAVRLIAILLLNTSELPDNKLEKWLLSNLDTDDYYKTLLILVAHSHLENFMNSIILTKGMSLLKTEEMIAFENTVSGTLLEAS